MEIVPTYSSSAFGLMDGTNNACRIMSPDYNEMLSIVYGLISKYQVNKIYIDAANPSLIKSKKWIGEDPDCDRVIARY